MTGITPVVVGKGMAGRAILNSLAIISHSDPELEILPVRLAERGAPFESYVSGETYNALFLANPSALHASSILEGIAAGFNAVASEKPVCVHAAEIDRLRAVQTFVPVYHGYRVMWGPTEIKRMISDGELGELFSLEARYWQSSAALADTGGVPVGHSWKNDPRLNGPHDALTDLGSHVVDMFLYLMADRPVRSRCRLFYRNAASPHRDTHVYLLLDFPGDRHATASISKTLHGAGNELEFTAVGTRGSATWRFQRPDEVEFGKGRRRTVIEREVPHPSSRSVPFHGLGWLEGYLYITHQTLRHVSGLNASPVPTISEALNVMEVLLHAEIERDEPL
jgi:predicted dehydrogenase